MTGARFWGGRTKGHRRKDMDEIRKLLQESLNKGLYQITVSKATHSGEGNAFKKRFAR